jgi:N-acetylglucosamine repressor
MQRPQTGDSRLIRELNQALVLNIIRNNSPISRTEIVNLSSLTYPTVSKAIELLAESQLVTSSGRGISRGGRRPLMLEFNPDAGTLIGVRVHKTRIQFGSFNLNQELLKYFELPLESTESDQVLTKIIQGIREVKASDRQLMGIGLGSPGRVQYADGTIVSRFALRWTRPVSLKSILESEFATPVFLENDVNVEALGEISRLPDSTPPAVVVYISVSNGVGAAVVLNGEIFHGSSGGAGELGHVSIDVNGKLCECGNRGCMETFISSAAIAAELNQPIPKSENVFLTLRQRMDNGDQQAVDVYSSLNAHLGAAACNLVNLFNPSHLIVGGDIIELGDQLLQDLRTKINTACTIVSFESENSLFYATLGDQAGIRGASVLAEESVFQNKLIANYSFKK